MVVGSVLNPNFAGSGMSNLVRRFVKCLKNQIFSVEHFWDSNQVFLTQERPLGFDYHTTTSTTSPLTGTGLGEMGNLSSTDSSRRPVTDM